MIYGAVLKYLIEKEIAGTDYRYSPADRAVLDEMVKEIKQECGVSVYYLAELDSFEIPGAGNIVAKYFPRFESESVRAFLLPHVVADKIADCDEFVYQWYVHFMNSDAYISPPGAPAPAHIYVRYDNMFRHLRSRKLKKRLTELVLLPRNAHYLPLTTYVLASWKVPELKDALIRYASGKDVTPEEVGIYDVNLTWYPPFDFILRELRFVGIKGLRFYRTSEVESLIRNMPRTDRDIAAALDKTIKYWDKQDARQK